MGIYRGEDELDPKLGIIIEETGARQMTPAELRQAKGIRVSEAPVGECRYCDEYRGRMHPSHDASNNCQSGKRSHCTCDTCF